MVFCLFSFRDFKDKAQGLKEIFLLSNRAAGDVRCWKSQQIARVFGYLWMNSVVQVMARIITKEKDHPWKGLARSYTHYGTNGYYRKMMKDVGFQNVQGDFSTVRNGQPFPRHEAQKLRPATHPVRLLNPLSLRNSTGVFYGYVRGPSKHQLQSKTPKSVSQMHRKKRPKSSLMLGANLPKRFRVQPTKRWP